MQITSPVQIGGLADSKMREAIGAVCVHWSLLELMVERVIANLKESPGTVTYEGDLAHRLDDLKAAAKQTLDQEDRERISEIAGFIKKLKEERHRIAHGLWALDHEGNFYSIFYRDKAGRPDRPATCEDIRAVKLLIWEAHEALSPFAGPGKFVGLPPSHIPTKQVPPRPVLPPDKRAKRNKP